MHFLHLSKASEFWGKNIFQTFLQICILVTSHHKTS